MTDDQSDRAKSWAAEAEDALNRTTESLKAAWEGTRDARMSTLEAAKEAANRLGEAIDQGIAVAKETWDPSREETPAAADEETPPEDDPTGEEE